MPEFQFITFIYIIKARVCVFVCGHSNVQTLTSPPVLKLWDSQGYLWLSYDLTEVINLIGETFEPKKKKIKKILYVIPSKLLSFLQFKLSSRCPKKEKSGNES